MKYIEAFIKTILEIFKRIGLALMFIVALVIVILYIAGLYPAIDIIRDSLFVRSDESEPIYVGILLLLFYLSPFIGIFVVEFKNQLDNLPIRIDPE